MDVSNVSKKATERILRLFYKLLGRSVLQSAFNVLESAILKYAILIVLILVLLAGALALLRG